MENSLEKRKEKIDEDNNINIDKFSIIPDDITEERSNEEGKIDLIAGPMIDENSHAEDHKNQQDIHENNTCQNTDTNHGQTQNTQKSNIFFNRDTLRKVGIGAAIAGGVIATAGIGAICLGFGAVGIGAGTVAAGIQAGIGNVAAGSWFATMTSWGMTGVFTTAAATGAGTAGAGAATVILTDKKSSEEEKKEKTNDEENKN